MPGTIADCDKDADNRNMHHPSVKAGDVSAPGILAD